MPTVVIDFPIFHRRNQQKLVHIFQGVEIPKDSDEAIEEQILETSSATVVELSIALGRPLRVSWKVSVLLCLKMPIQAVCQVFFLWLRSPSIRGSLFSEIFFSEFSFDFESIFLWEICGTLGGRRSVCHPLVEGKEIFFRLFRGLMSSC